MAVVNSILTLKQHARLRLAAWGAYTRSRTFRLRMSFHSFGSLVEALSKAVAQNWLVLARPLADFQRTGY